MGCLPDYRVNDLTHFIATEVLKYNLKNIFSPRIPISFCVMNSPVSYLAFRHIPECFSHTFYPHWDEQKQGEKIKRLARKCAEYFSYELLEDKPNLVNDSFGYAQTPLEERNKWLAHSHPSVTFFLKNNPNYLTENPQGEQNLMFICTDTSLTWIFAFKIKQLYYAFKKFICRYSLKFQSKKAALSRQSMNRD